MNIKTFSIIAALAAAASAHAVSVTNANGAAELVLGFGAPDATSNLEVALGTAAYYTGLNATMPTQIGRLDVDDLTQNFGAGWANRSDLEWGIIGFNGSAVNNTAWASREVVTAGVQTTAWNRANAGVQNTNIGTKVKGLELALSNAVANGGNEYSLAVGSSTLTSWKTYIGTSGLAFGGYTKTEFNNDTIMTVTDSFANGVALSDLFEMASGSGAGTYIGTFGIDADGALWFANNAAAFAAVPEPSTYAMILAGLTLGVVAYRRRFVNQA